jgi:formate hydrogenlyase subunit 6/NADH:ubiquinone oxidoreductase subunit I
MSKPAANAAAVGWQKLLLPALDERRCIGCGRCVAVCPTACLEMDGSLPWMPRPRDCIRCAACVFVCPTTALALPEP